MKKLSQNLRIFKIYKKISDYMKCPRVTYNSFSTQINVEENFIKGIRNKNKKNIYEETENSKDSSIFKKILHLKKRSEYEFEYLNSIVDEFLKSQNKNFNISVTNQLLEVLGHNYFFKSNIIDYLVELMKIEDENLIFTLHYICGYIFQINGSRRILLEFPQSFYQNLEKIFFNKGFLLNIKELSIISKTLVRYNLHLSHSFYDYIERCILNNIENKIIKNQSFMKESINVIINRYCRYGSLNFTKKLFESVKENIKSEDYLPEEIYQLIDHICRGMHYHTSRKDEKYQMSKEMCKWILNNYIDSLKTSLSFNFTIFKNIYFLILDYPQLFEDNINYSYIGDTLFIPKLIEKINHLNINDVSLLLNKVNKRSLSNKNMYPLIEPLILSQLPNINEWNDFYNFFNFFTIHHIFNPTVFKFFEAKFILLVLNKKDINCIIIANIIFKYISLYRGKKTFSNFFIAFLNQFIDELEKTVDIKMEAVDKYQENTIQLENFNDENSKIEVDNLDSQIEINKV